MRRPFQWPAPFRAALSLTFDDSRLSQVGEALPILRSHGVRATFYVSFGALEQRLDEWRAAFAGGHEPGNHSLTHPCTGNFGFIGNNALEDYDLDRIEAEMLAANSMIYDLVGRAPATYGYPCGQTFVGRGASTRSYVPLVARHFAAGRLFNSESANDPSCCDLAQILAISADGLTPDQCLGWVNQALETGGWLVFAAHEVGDGGRQTMLRASLEAVCAHCRRPGSGVWIDTVEAIAHYVRSVRPPE